MDRTLAEIVVTELEKKKFPPLTILEAMSMTKIMSDSHEIYAIHKDGVTFLVWKDVLGKIDTKIQRWW